MSLHTLATAAAHSIEVRRSRFTAHAAPVATVDDAMHALADVAVADATHNCWAWRIGGEYRANDDGEPTGTAGRPILAAIDGQGIDQVIVVVTRWFGGIKLGAGGLVRAYGGAAAECLRRAERRPLVAISEIVVHVPFEDLGTAHAALVVASAEKTAETFDASGARLALRLPSDNVDALKLHLRDATRNRVRFNDNG
jgi:uncharacterized YigZ family protein